MRRKLRELGDLFLQAQRDAGLVPRAPVNIADYARQAADASARRRRGRPLSQEHRDKIRASWARRRRFGLPE